jgi:hypothetical protein
MVFPLAEKDNMHIDSIRKQNKSEYLFQDKLSQLPTRNWFFHDDNWRAISLNLEGATKRHVSLLIN